MLDSSKFMEKLLQSYRFYKARPFLRGDVLDFGGNQGELKKYVNGKYSVINYNHSAMANVHFDTIVCLAVIEHMTLQEVYEVFHKFNNILNQRGRIFLTTPSIMAKPILEFMAFLKMIDRVSLAEHKYYWRKKDIYALAEKTGFIIKKYKKFQLGFNQLVILEHQR